MSLILNEFYSGKTGLSVGIEKVLFSEQSSFQRVEVFKTDTWGNLLTIDGMVMLSEKDEFVYHEMLSHVGMFTHPKPERVLIIGGGDGGTAREALRHPSVKEVDLVEIDEVVIRASKRYLPDVGKWDDDRLNVIHEDGIQFVREVNHPYDLIIIDGSDPVGPASGLFSTDFLSSCYESLSEDGVLTVQTESPWIRDYHETIKHVFTALDTQFPVTKMYIAHIPLYPSGMWSFVLAGKVENPLSEDTVRRVKSGLGNFGNELKYYNRDIHLACFGLPNFVKQIVE